MFTEQPQLLIEVVEVTPQVADLERARRIRGVLTQMSLRDEKVLVEGTQDNGDGSMSTDLGWTPAPMSPEASLEAGPSSRVH